MCSRVAHEPIVLITDINHPFGDLDDHIDVAVAHGLRLPVSAVILDEHSHLFGGSGDTPMAQAAVIASTSWPTHDGAALGTTDTALLDVLAAAPAPVTIVIVGSCRDLAAAIVADLELLRCKVSRIVVFAGDATAPWVEYNVSLDPASFVTVMASGLPIQWIPCFDGGLWVAGMRSSFVQVPTADVFPADLPAPVQRFFSYRLLGATSDPIDWIRQPITVEDRQVLSSGLRNLWAAGLLECAISGRPVRWDGREVARFEPVEQRFAMSGAADPAGPVVANVERFTVLDPVQWPRAMVRSTVNGLRAMT